LGNRGKIIGQDWRVKSEGKKMLKETGKLGKKSGMGNGEKSTRRMRGIMLQDNIELKKIPRDLLEKCDFQEDKK
jgi:hypothetical protein